MVKNKLFVLLLLGVFLISFASAFEIDNVMTYNEQEDTIIFTNAFGLGQDLVKAKLNKNLCTEGRFCEAIKTITLYEETQLIQDFKTLRIDDNSWDEKNIRWHKLEYWGEVDDFENQCTEGEEIIQENGTSHTPSVCEIVKVGSHEGWVQFKEGDIFKEGIYEVKTSGEIRPGRVYDWQVKIEGDWTTPWATWGNISLGDDAEVILNSPADESTTYSNPVTFNATANITGGATLANISLWTNESGNWEIRNTSLFDSGDNVTYGHGETMVNCGFACENVIFRLGVNITMQRDSNLTAVEKEGTATTAYVCWSNGTLIASASFSGDIAVFPGITLLNGESYHILTGHSSNYDRTDFGSLPTDNTTFTWTEGVRLNTGSPPAYDGLNGYMIRSLNFSTDAPSATQTWNRIITDTTLWNIQACDSDGDCGFAPSNYTVFLDTGAPTISVESPSGTLDYNAIGNNETLNVTFTDSNLDSCWYNYNGTNITIDGCLTGVKNSTQFILEEDNLNMTIYANDSIGNLNSEFIEWDYLVLQLNQTFEENKTEAETNDFSILLDIADGSLLDSATFIYNNTNYTTSIVFASGLYLVASSIVSPSVDADTNFSFVFSIVVDGTDLTTASNNQTVINSLFDICGGTSNDTLLNMFLFDEGTLLNLSGDIEISASIISKSSGASIGTINKSFEDIHSGAICFSPISSYNLYYLYAEIRYESDGYAAEFYHIQKADMEDYPINLSLYDLNLNDSTEFVVTYKNNAFIFEEGTVIQLQRKYIGEDIYRVVEAPITSDGGKAILHIDLNSIKYQASVVKDGELLDFFNNVVLSCDNELSGDCTYSFDGTVNPNNDVPIETITDFTYSISVDEDNQEITVLFAVPSGTSSTINVALEQLDMFGNSTSCDTTVITSAGSITCGYTDTIEKSILELSISKNDIQLVIVSYVNDPILDMDGMNFFIAFLFMISLVGMAIASPEWMILISVMVLIISGTMLLLKGVSLVMGLGAIAWVIIAAAIIIMKMSKQEDR